MTEQNAPAPTDVGPMGILLGRATLDAQQARIRAHEAEAKLKQLENGDEPA